MERARKALVSVEEISKLTRHFEIKVFLTWVSRMVLEESVSNADALGEHFLVVKTL